LTNIYRKKYIKNLYYSLISISGLFLLGFLVFYTQNLGINYLQRELILSIFILICLLGMFAAVSPSRCTEFLYLKKDQKSDWKLDESDSSDIGNKFKGHHPDCDNFKTHTFSLNDTKYCAGCSGLFIGAFIAVIGTITYNFYGIPDAHDGRLIFFIGFITLFVYLFQDLLLDINLNLTKFFFNMLLVLGSFMILIGINELNSNILIQLFFMILVFIWILGRIASSEKKHNEICDKCTTKSYCNYR
jgi:hypothetical protein